ncbi:hypothetical protein [Marinicrinis lubricantis]|uniref:Aldouronate transport system substrate-binding protein n=1 Tax=Marinicrinis lubricantis TaxID=2086470 RepID=A0ABW1ISX3_9BACL
MTVKGIRLWIISCLVFMMLVVTACGNNGNGQQEEGAANAGSGQASSEPVKISWLGNGTAGLYPEEDSYVVQKLNERFNVELEVVEATSTNEQEMSMLYASGDIPNHFLVSANGIANVIEQGLARTVPVGMIQEVAPNLWAATLENYPLLERMSIYKDGELLAIPQGTRELFPLTAVRTDWLEELGLDMPTSLEELEEVARQFTEEDPDGDGQNNTYAFSMTTGYHNIYTIAAAFGISLPGGTVKDDMWLEGEDGRLIKAQVSENFKELTMYLANLYEKGYIYPDVNVKDDGALFSDGIVGMRTAGWTALMPKYRPSDWYAMTFTKNPQATTDYLPPLMGPNGEEAVFENQSSVWRYTGIGKDTTDEQLKKILEIMDTQLVDMDVHNLIWRGEEGVHYTVNENGMAVLTEEYSSQEKQAEAGLKFFIVNNRNEEQMELSFGSEAEPQRKVQENYKTKEQLIPSGTIIESASKYGADVEKVEKEFFLNVVTGIWDAEKEWDSYVKRWHAAGGEEITNEVNEIYENL